MADKIDQLTINSNDYDITLPVDDKNAMFYTTESATANAFTVAIPGIDALVDGMIINVKFNAATAEGATLNVNNLGAKAIYYRTATAITGHIVANNYVTLVYDDTNDHWVMQFAYDSAGSNTIGYQLRTNSTVWANKTGYTMNRRTLLFEVDGGLSGAATSIATGTSKTTVNFKYIPGGVIKYYSTSGSIAANANFGATGLWDQYAIDLKYTFNTGSTLVTNKPVYMRCVINTDGTLTPDYTGSPKHPIAQTLPASDDGKVYVYLGKAISTSAMELYVYHPIYQFKDNKICLYTGSSGTTDTNYYHKTGSWSGLTYTAEKVGSPEDLSFTIPTGAIAGTVCVGNDSRLSDARTPTSHTHGNINNSGQITATESTTTNVKHIAVCVDDSGTVKKMTPTNVRTAIGAGTSNFTGYTSSNKLSTDYINNVANWSSFSGYTSSNKLSTDYINNVAGWTSNAGTVTSVTIKAGTGLASSSTAAITTSGERTISIASGYKLPTTTEWSQKQDLIDIVDLTNL